MAQRTTERRRLQREEYAAPLHYRPSALHGATAVDLSQEGMAFETEQALEPGTALELFLINKNVHLNAVVEYAQPLNGGRCRIGVAFEKPEPELVEVLLAAQAVRQD